MKEFVCALCENSAIQNEIRIDALSFCCHGCSAVYQILEAQNQLSQKKGHPLIREAVKYGLIANQEIRTLQEGDCTKKWGFEVGKMWCPSCAQLICLALERQKGVTRAVVDYVTDLALVEYNPKEISEEEIQKIIESLGYQVSFFEEKRDPLTLKFAVAAFAALNVMMFAYPLYTTYFDFDEGGIAPLLAWISLGFTVPVVTYSALPLYSKVRAQLKMGIPGMEVLVVIGMLSAFILSLYEMFKGTFLVYFDTITVLVAFLLLGKMIESKAKFSTKQALYRLQNALPKKGRKKSSNAFVPLKEVEVGDELIVFSGERIVIDGEIVDGEGAVDESIITGESVPKFKKKGDLIFSGSILQSGRLIFKATSKHEKSTLHHLIDLIDISGKTSSYRVVDSVLKWFTPLVLALSFFTFMGTFIFVDADSAFSRSMAVLLIACPCAIGIAAPLIESKLIERFTEKGALIRNRELLAKLPNITHFIFDKTGTVTKGEFSVLSGLEKLSDEQKKKLKTLASSSIHPVAKAINSVLQCEPEDFKIIEIPGKGIKGEGVYLGSKKFLEEAGFQVDEEAAVYFADQGVHPLYLGDTIKEDAKELIRNLPFKTILLSGDSKGTVEKVAREIGFDEWQGEKTPLEKQQYVVSLKKAVVAMIGDGINDAPSLAKADIGISVVSAADISIQVSDLLLTTPNLNIITDLIQMAKRGKKLIAQNLFWAFFYNVIGVFLACFGVLTPLFASFAMITSSLIILLNSKRLSARKV